MTETEKAYIAGIIDGEGSIMLQRFHTGEYPSPCISIASTTLELLNWIKSVVCKGIIVNKKNYNPERHQDCYSYTLKYKSVTPRNGRYSEEILESKLAFYDEFMSIKR